MRGDPILIPAPFVATTTFAPPEGRGRRARPSAAGTGTNTIMSALIKRNGTTSARDV